MTRLTPWLRAALEARGDITPDGLTARLAARRCPRCRALCLAGIDDDGIGAWLDPSPLDPAGELAALLDGAPAWSPCHGTAGLIRTAHAIEASPAGSDPWRPVLAAHRCGVARGPLPAPEPPPTQPPTEGCPF